MLYDWNYHNEDNLLICKYVIYFHMLFCFVEAIIDQHSQHGLVAGLAVFPHNYSMIFLLYCPIK